MTAKISTHNPAVLYHFQQSLTLAVRKRMIKLLGALTFVLIFFYIFLLVPFSEHKLMPWIIMPLIFSVPFIMDFYEIYKISKGVGEWLIQVTTDELSWQSPTGIGEESFSLKISEILKLTETHHKGNEDRDSYSNHFIIKRNGEEILLPETPKNVARSVLLALKKTGVC